MMMNNLNDLTFSERAARMSRSAVREFVKLTTRPGLISFAGGLPAPELFPVQEMEDAATRVFSRIGAGALQYGETEGLPELRDWLARAFSTASFEVRREHVLITNGAQQALHLLGLVLLDEQDTVLAENPTYLALLSAWRTLGAQFRALPCDAQGICVEQLESSRARHDCHPKLLYVQPNFQNPQGTTLPAHRRPRLIEWARARKLFLIEDNAYGELRYEGEALPHLLQLAGSTTAASPDHAGVAHVGTFSKVIAPGLRIGWVIGPANLIDKLTQAKQAADLHTSTLNQYLVLDLLQDGLLERHLPVLRSAYRTRRNTMLSALARHFPKDLPTHPQGGLFVMLSFADQRNTRNLLPHALARGVAFVPGDEFYLDGTGHNTMRLNFSNASPEKIEEGLAKLEAAARAP